MGFRDSILAMMDSLFGYGRVTATEQAPETNQVLASIEGNAQSDGSNAESRPSQALWGHAAIVWRPTTETEVIFVRSGEEMVPIASRDVRWQVDLAEGDVVVRALGSSAKPKLTLKADGTAILEADTVVLGNEGATNTIGLGDVIQNHLDSIRTTFNAHTHVAGSLTSPSGGGAVTGTSGIPGSLIDATPDCQSRHKVEN